MVAVYVGGKKVGTWAEAERLIEQHARTEPIEFRDEAGNLIARTEPGVTGEPLVPWDPTITAADLDRIAAEPSFPFEEVKKRLGWE